MNQTIYISQKQLPNKQTSIVYPTITQALNSLPKEADQTIYLHILPGVYHEKIEIKHPNLVIEGESPENTIISYDDYAYFILPDGHKRGTFRSYTCFLDSNDITLRNLTIENASGPSKLAGQAIALYADGDRLVIDNCHLKSCQDTLFTGPLPPSPYEPGGFIGPKEFAPRINGRQYYRHCQISGDIDFIFGSATAYFEDCELHSIRRNDTDNIQGYVTAASTPIGQDYGYVFDHCKFTGDCPNSSVYLGRPWREYAKTVLLSCTTGPHIHPGRFHDWEKSNVHNTIYYAEYDTHFYSETSSKTSSNLSSSKNPEDQYTDDSNQAGHLSSPANPSVNSSVNSSVNPFVHFLSKEDAQNYSIDRVLGGADSWNPHLLR